MKKLLLFFLGLVYLVFLLYFTLTKQIMTTDFVNELELIRVDIAKQNLLLKEY